MDWDAVGAWLDKGQTPDFAKLARHAVTVLYIDPTAPNAAAVRDVCAPQGVTCGAYVAASWFAATADPSVTADYASSIVQGVFPKIAAEAPPAMLDLEDRTATWKSSFIARWRTHQPKRPTAYTDAPFKSGDAPVAVLQQQNMPVFVQLYLGDMAPVDASAAILDLCRAGMPASMVHPFYDGAAPVDFGARDGCFFTMGRLP